MTPAEVADKAIELLQQGWAKGQWQVDHPDGQSCYCVGGAVRAALGISPLVESPEVWNTGFVPWAVALHTAAMNHGSEAFGTYNDAVAKTVDDVIRLVREAQEIMERKTA